MPNIEMSADEAEMPPDEERQAIEILDALGDEISAKAVWLAARDFYQPRVSELEVENECDACGGTGTPVSGLPCMCRGTGRMSEAARYLREENARLQTALENLSNSLVDPHNAEEPPKDATN